MIKAMNKPHMDTPNRYDNICMQLGQHKQYIEHRIRKDYMSTEVHKQEHVHGGFKLLDQTVATN